MSGVTFGASDFTGVSAGRPVHADEILIGVSIAGAAIATVLLGVI